MGVREGKRCTRNTVKKTAFRRLDKFKDSMKKAEKKKRDMIRKPM